MASQVNHDTSFIHSFFCLGAQSVLLGPLGTRAQEQNLLMPCFLIKFLVTNRLKAQLQHITPVQVGPLPRLMHCAKTMAATLFTNLPAVCFLFCCSYYDMPG
jgi:hypothetical protein